MTESPRPDDQLFVAASSIARRRARRLDRNSSRGGRRHDDCCRRVARARASLAHQQPRAERMGSLQHRGRDRARVIRDGLPRDRPGPEHRSRAQGHSSARSGHAPRQRPCIARSATARADQPSPCRPRVSSGARRPGSRSGNGIVEGPDASRHRPQRWRLQRERDHAHWGGPVRCARGGARCSPGPRRYQGPQRHASGAGTRRAHGLRHRRRPQDRCADIGMGCNRDATLPRSRAVHRWSPDASVGYLQRRDPSLLHGHRVISGAWSHP